uniref:RNase H type-1 domain-containing protein n=1 Tax=Chenopodium quinoa TaxID=63459 RepID=A0A803M6K4_CHEQI
MARDDCGRVLDVMTHRVEGDFFFIVLAEAMAARMGMVLVSNFGYRSEELECDSLLALCLEKYLGAKALLLDDLKWRFGNGDRINVWEDDWLLGETACKVPTLNLHSPTDLKVSDLIDYEYGDWNEAPLNEHLTDEDTGLIYKAPRSSFSDVFVWMTEKLSGEDLISFAAMSWATWSLMRGVLPRNAWVRPAAGVVRINTDAAVIAGVGGVGLGVCIRDDQGKLLATIVCRESGNGSVRLAEALATRWGIKIEHQLGFGKAELECDALEVLPDASGRATTLLQRVLAALSQ